MTDAGGRGAQSLLARAALAAAGTLLACAAASAQPSPCRTHAGSATISRVWLEAALTQRRDTLHTVRVCLRPASTVGVGSFHIVIEYDSSLMRSVRFVPGQSGTMVANLTHPGRADVAGADPAGFGPGQLLSIVFADTRRARSAKRTSLAMALRLLELNATGGEGLLPRAATAGIGVLKPGRAPVAETLTPKSAETPHIDSLAPSRAKVAGPGGLVPVTIHGSGFHPQGNVVLFAGAEIAELRSADGTSLRLILPAALPASGEVPPRVLGAGRYEIRIRTNTGTSNPMEFTLETPP